MLDVTLNRRSMLRVGALALGGLTLPDLLKARADGSASNRKSVILVWLAGGPSHIDMYDLKPNAPAEVRGEFKPIQTNVPGVQIGEHLPLQAKIFDKLSVVRSAYHTNAGHGMGSQWMLTGWQPTIEVSDNIFPSCGSVVSKMLGPNEPGLPAYVNLPRQIGLGKAAYLGASHNPFSPEDDPNNDNFQVRNLKLPGRVGDSPIIGHGLYCDSDAGGAVATGLGEEMAKVCGAFLAVERMRQGVDPSVAIREVLERAIRRDPKNRKTLLAMVALRADGMIGSGAILPGFQAAIARGTEHERRVGTTSTGQRAWRTTRSETLPIRRCDRPDRPCVPRTIRFDFPLPPAATISSAGRPIRTAVVAPVSPASLRLLTRSSSRRACFRCSSTIDCVAIGVPPSTSTPVNSSGSTT